MPRVRGRASCRKCRKEKTPRTLLNVKNPLKLKELFKIERVMCVILLLNLEFITNIFVRV